MWLKLTRIVSLLLIVVGGFALFSSTRASTNCGSRKVVRSPGSNLAALSGVVAISTKNVWAVGADTNGLLIEHWNGGHWSSVPSPNLGIGSSLNGVAAISANNIWAVGTGALVTVIEHWNGTNWTLVSSPNASDIDELNAVASSTDNCECGKNEAFPYLK